MSEENSNSNEGEGIASLRKSHDELAKKYQAAENELAQFRAEKRQTTVAEVLKAKGLPAKAASLYSGDDVSEDAVNKWVEQYGEVFGVKQDAGGAQAAADANAQAAARLSAASGGQPDVGVPQYNPGMIIGDPAEIEHAIRTLPMEELVRLGYMPQPGGLYNPIR